MILNRGGIVTKNDKGEGLLYFICFIEILNFIFRNDFNFIPVFFCI